MVEVLFVWYLDLDVRIYFLLLELWKSTGRNYIGIFVMGKMVEDGVASIFSRGMRAWLGVGCVYYTMGKGRESILRKSCKHANNLYWLTS
jgi:hypothetical protein